VNESDRWFVGICPLDPRDLCAVREFPAGCSLAQYCLAPLLQSRYVIFPCARSVRLLKIASENDVAPIFVGPPPLIQARRCISGSIDDREDKSNKLGQGSAAFNLA